MLIYFLLTGIVLSYLGSLPPGIISLSVVELYLKKGWKPVIIFSLGACMVEMVQAWLALQAAQFLQTFDTFTYYFRIASVPILLGLGIYFYFFEKGRGSKKGEARALDFGKGMITSALNLLAIPYWFFYGLYLESNGILHFRPLTMSIFVLGTGLGTFALLMTYAKLSDMLESSLAEKSATIHQVIGFIFFVLAAIQIYLLITPN